MLPRTKLTRKSLPCYYGPAFDSRAGRVPLGTYQLLAARKVGGILWHHITHDGDAVWIVAEEGGRTWAREVDGFYVAFCAPVGDWRAVLAQEQAEQDWVVPMYHEAMSLIPDGATAIQRAACEAMISLIGIRESDGQNQGPALTPGLVQPWQDALGITDEPDDPWCVIAACWAWCQALGRHALGIWCGGAWDVERRAQDLDLWYPAREGLGLLDRSNVVGGILCMDRSGSGSDAITPVPGMPQGYYPGHGAIVLRVDGSKVRTVTGNVKNTCLLRDYELSKTHGIAVLP